MCALSLIEKEAIILENDADPQRILNILIELQFASEEGYIYRSGDSSISCRASTFNGSASL